MCEHGWCEGADSFERCTPKTWYHIDGESQGNHSKEELWHVGAVLRVVVRELEPTEEVDSKQTEDDNPQTEEHLAVEDVPAVGKVGNGEELQGESQLDETEHNLNNVHPSTRLWSRLQEAWEHGEQCERYGKGDGEAKHADGWCKYAALCGNGYEKEADDWTCAGE